MSHNWLLMIKCITSQSGAVVMIGRLLPCIAVLAGLLLQADALSSRMTEDESPDFLDFPGNFSEERQREIEADNSMHEVNVTGAWSIDLLGEPKEKMKLYLLQNGSLISGQGKIIGGENARKATASGSISGLEMRLKVVPAAGGDLYRLNLSLSSLAGGRYSVYQGDGGIRSGNFTFAVSANIFEAASGEEEWEI